MHETSRYGMNHERDTVMDGLQEKSTNKRNKHAQWVHTHIQDNTTPKMMDEGDDGLVLAACILIFACHRV